MTSDNDAREWVGPVLQKGPTTDGVIGAIKELNEEVAILDRGAYVRILVLRRCHVTRLAIERHTGESYRLPSDLELIMSSFKGRFEVTEDEAVWQLGKQSK